MISSWKSMLFLILATLMFATDFVYGLGTRMKFKRAFPCHKNGHGNVRRYNEDPDPDGDPDQTVPTLPNGTTH